MNFIIKKYLKKNISIKIYGSIIRVPWIGLDSIKLVLKWAFIKNWSITS